MTTSWVIPGLRVTQSATQLHIDTNIFFMPMSLLTMDSDTAVRLMILHQFGATLGMMPSKAQNTCPHLPFKTLQRLHDLLVMHVIRSSGRDV